MGKWTGAAGLLCLLGCTSASKPADMGDMALPICSITMSGALSGNYLCTLTATYESGKDVGIVEVTNNNPPIATTVTLGAGGEGMLAAGTYTDGDPTAIGSCGVEVMSGSTVEQWEANAGGPAPHDGSYKMELTSVAMTGSGGGNVRYDVHGTLDATLAPVASTGAMGTITVTAAF